MDLWELDTRVAPQLKASLALIDEAAPRSERAVYASLAAISVGAASAAADLGDGAEAVVFCGANAHDLANSARPGLRAAGELGILCPLADLSPETVTVLAQVCPLSHIMPLQSCPVCLSGCSYLQMSTICPAASIAGISMGSRRTQPFCFFARTAARDVCVNWETL